MRLESVLTTHKSSTLLSSLTRSIEVLELIAHSNGLQVKEISHSLRINLSTTYHILNTLESLGYLKRDKHAYYTLGPKIPYLNDLYVENTIPERRLRQGLQELVQLCGETVYYGEERDGYFQIQVIIENYLSSSVSDVYVGNIDKPASRVLSKVIMAHWPIQKVLDVIGQHSLDSPDFSVVDLESLVSELREVRETGYCYGERESCPGVVCISSPIFERDGSVRGAYGIAMSREHFYHGMEHMVETLHAVTRKVSKDFGYLM